MSDQLRQSLSDQWTYHIGRCDECKGYPTLCLRGKHLHRRLWPQDWDEDKPTHGTVLSTTAKVEAKP